MAAAPTAPLLDSDGNREDSTQNSESEAKKDDKDTGEEKNDAMFECNICLDTAKDAVVR